VSSKTIISRLEPDGRLMWKTEDGWAEVAIPPLAANFPDGEPAYDSENPQLTGAQLARMKRISQAKALRWKLGLTQEEFAARYQIPIGTLRDWEQGRSKPDAPAKAYLKVIAADPEGVAEKLGRE
jgi:putative transcriptional regulator